MPENVNWLSVVIIVGFGLYLIWYSLRILLKGDFIDPKDQEKYARYTEESRKKYARVSSLLTLLAALLLIGAAAVMVFRPAWNALYWTLVGTGFASAVASVAVMFPICKEKPPVSAQPEAEEDEDEDEDEEDDGEEPGSDA